MRQFIGCFDTDQESIDWINRYHMFSQPIKLSLEGNKIFIVDKENNYKKY